MKIGRGGMTMNLNTVEEDYSDSRSYRDPSEENIPLLEVPTISTFSVGKHAILSFLCFLITLAATILVCLLFYYNVFSSWYLLFKCGGILGWLFTIPFIGSMICLLTWNSFFVSKLATAIRKPTEVSHTQHTLEDPHALVDKHLKLKHSLKLIIKIVSLAVVSAVGVLGMLSLVIMSAVWIYIKNGTISDRSTTLEYSQLKEEVIVKRDVDSGLIHIHAKNDEDLFFAQGVVAAQERLWQLEFNKRVGRGRLSEIVGDVEAATSIDRLMRTVGFYRSAQRDWKVISETDPTTKLAIEQFTAGVNAYVESKQSQKPFEFIVLGVKVDPWTPEDAVTWIKLMSWDLSANVKEETRRLKLLLNGEKIERVKEMYPFFDITKETPTVLSKKDMGIDHLTPAEIEAIEKRLRNESGSFIPNQVHKQNLSFRSILDRVSLFSADGSSSGRASNNWVVGPQLTKTKKPLLCNDPHLRLTSPSIWYLIHLHSPTFDAVGAGLPSVPGIIIGRNADISWGVTNTFADVQDLFVINEIDENHYAHPSCQDNKCAYNIIEEKISVKGADDIVLKIKETIYGPAINDVMDITYSKPISMWWTTTQLQDTTIICITHLLKSKNWTDFKDALKFYISPAQNFIYADKEGNIGYFMPGKVPIRKEGHSGRFPVEGNGNWDYMPSASNPDGDFIPFEKLPQVLNPEKGYVVSANFRIPPLGYEYGITFDHAPHYRAARIVELVEKLAPEHTVSTMRSIHMDTVSLLFKKFNFLWNDTEILHMLPKDYHDEWMLLSQWDGDLIWGSQPATLFEGLWKKLRNLPMDKYGFSGTYVTFQWIISALQNPAVDPACEPYRSCRRYAALSFMEVVDAVKSMKGGEIPMWGVDVHDTSFGHSLLDETPLKCVASRAIRNVGGSMTVNVNENSGVPDFLTTEGVSYRHIVSWDDVDKNSEFITAPGQSGNMLEDSYDNWLEMWRRGEYIPMTTNSEDINAQIQRFKPSK